MIGKKVVLKCDACLIAFGMRDGSIQATIESLRDAARKEKWSCSVAGGDRCPACQGKKKTLGRLVGR